MPRKQSHDAPVCGANKRRGGVCHSYAGRGTDHPGEGKCKHHGGNAGAPAGNKNAVTTGRYESILLDTLDDEERELFESARLRAELALVEEEIGLVTVRERRMLKRIDALKQNGELTLVEETTEVLAADGEQAEVSDRILSQLSPEDADELTGAGIDPEQQVTKVKTKRQGTLGQIQAVESALTDVQKTKHRLIDLKHKIKTQLKGGENVNLTFRTGDGEEASHGFSDKRRVAGIDALLERVRERTAGPLPGADTE